MASSLSWAMPMPLSLTSMPSTTVGDCCSSFTSIRTPPFWVNFSALPTRLVMIWRRRAGSTSICAGSDCGYTTSRPICFSSALTRMMAATSLTTSCTAQGMRSTSMRPASTLDRSRMSLISASRCLPLDTMVSRWRCDCEPPLCHPRLSSSAKPRMAFMGVRISWLMLARKSLLARLAASAASRARRSWISFSSRLVTSSRLTSMPADLPPAPGTMEPFIMKLRRWPCASGRYISTLRKAWPSVSTTFHNIGGTPSCTGCVHPRLDTALPVRASPSRPSTSAKALLASTICPFGSSTNRPSARVSNAVRTRPGITREGSRCLRVRLR